MDKAKKNRMKRAITWAGIAALVLLLAVMPLLAKQEAEADGPVASVLSAQVTRGDIPQTLRGGGTLQDKGEQEVNLPTGVKITEFLVKNGEAVKAGDPVARVDRVSVMAAITEVAETMEYLREELEEGRDEKVASQVTATAGGRVKEIFAQAGDSVQDVMLRDGALALLSIDGMMAVKLEIASPVTTGESVTVTLSDGSQVSGRVESNLSGAVIVTVEDEDYPIGGRVTVSREDGTVLGSGTLYVHNAWKATAYSGTIQNVNIRKEQVLSSGAALFTLTDTDYEGQLRRRASQHREYEELLQRLLTMYDSGVLTAPCDGLVAGVDEDSVHLLSAEEFDAEVTLLDGRGMGTVRLMLLSNGCTGSDTAADCKAGAGQHIGNCPKAVCNPGSACEASAGNHATNCILGCTRDASCQNETGFHQGGCYMLCAGDAGTAPEECPNGENGNHKSGCIYRCSGKGTTAGGCSGTKNHYLSCIESCAEAQKETDSCPATGAHKGGCIRSCVRADTTGICRNGPHYTDCIGSCTGQSNCPASKHLSTCQQYGMTYTATAAKVYSVGTSELVVFWDASGTQYPVEKTGAGWTIVGAQLNEALLVSRGTLSAGNAKSFKPGDIVLCVTGTKNGAVEYQDVVFYKSSGSGGMGQFAGMDFNFNFDLSSMMGGFAGYGITAPAAEAETLYDTEGSPIATVTPEEGVFVDVLLDERDISKVQEGMEATIRVEALRGKSFTGIVTKVGSIGDHSGSTGKFTVRVETDFIPDSLPGMSCMVNIHRDTREDVLTLPVAAVSQDGAKTIVYTALDPKTGQPAAPQEITTGVSDGEMVEVFGLDEGTQVYYLYYDVHEIDHSAKERQFNMN